MLLRDTAFLGGAAPSPAIENPTLSKACFKLTLGPLTALSAASELTLAPLTALSGWLELLNKFLGVSSPSDWPSALAALLVLEVASLLRDSNRFCLS